MPAACRRERTIARRSQPPRRTSTRKPGSRPPRLAQIAHQNEPVVTSKCASGRPLLIDSAPPTEFRATHSKQTTEKFLTGARTHIRIFSFWTFTTQNPSQLIQRPPMYLEEKHSKYSANVNLLLSRRFTRASFRFNTRSVFDNRRRNPYEIPKTVSPENSTVTLFLSRLPSQLDQSAMAALPAAAPADPTVRHSGLTRGGGSTRFCTKYRKRRNLLKTNDRKISTRGHNHPQRAQQSALFHREKCSLPLPGFRAAGSPPVL